MNGKLLILVFVSLQFNTGCKPKEAEATAVPRITFTIPQPDLSPRDLVVFEVPSSIYGKWMYQSDNIFYSASLKFNRDSSFEYINQGCTQISFTKGTFVSDGSVQILTSLNKFKSRPVSLLPDTTYLYWKQKRFIFKGGSLYDIETNGQIGSVPYLPAYNQAVSE